MRRHSRPASTCRHASCCACPVSSYQPESKMQAKARLHLLLLPPGLGLSALCLQPGQINTHCSSHEHVASLLSLCLQATLHSARWSGNRGMHSGLHSIFGRSCLNISALRTMLTSEERSRSRPERLQQGAMSQDDSLLGVTTKQRFYCCPPHLGGS